MPFSHHYITTLLPLSSGVLLALSFPPFNLALLIFVALIPLTFAVYKHSTSLNSKIYSNLFLTGFLCGLSYFSLLMNWLIYTLMKYGNLPSFISIILFLLLVSYLAIFFGLFTCFLGYFFRKNSQLTVYHTIIVSFIWVYLEFIREHFLTGLPWGNLGYALDKLLLIIQIVDITGVYGLTFIIILTNLILFNILTAENKKIIIQNLTLLFTIWTVFLSYGVISYSIWENPTMDGTKSLKAISLQGNIPQDIKWDRTMIDTTISIYEELTRSIVSNNNDKTLVVFPETAMPFYFVYDKEHRSRIERLTKELNIEILTGAPHFEDDTDGKKIYKNSAFLVANGNVIDRYDKYHLVPFGEYIPLSRYFSWLSKYLPTAGDFTSGERIRPLDARDYRLGVLICFESIFPYITRVLVSEGAEVLAIITNDAWFGRSGAPYQHEQFAVFRAIESRRWVIRSANTGVSSIISPSGKRIRQADIFIRTGITAKVKLINKKTIYTRYFNFIFFLFNVIMLRFIVMELRFR